MKEYRAQRLLLLKQAALIDADGATEALRLAHTDVTAWKDDEETIRHVAVYDPKHQELAQWMGGVTQLGAAMLRLADVPLPVLTALRAELGRMAIQQDDDKRGRALAALASILLVAEERIANRGTAAGEADPSLE